MNSPQSVLAAGDHFGGKLSLSEFDPLSHANLAPWPDERVPLFRSYLPGQKDFNFGGQKFAPNARIPSRFFGSDARPAAEEPRRNDQRVVHHNQFIAAEE